MSESIVGSWYIANPGGGTDQIVITFLANGTFLIADKGTPARDPSGTSGLEWGTYTWNAATGALSMAFPINTDLQWGLSGPDGPPNAVVSGNNLVLSGPDGSFTVPRLVSAPDSVVGSWYAEFDGGATQVVFTLLDDGSYLFADKGLVANDPSGTPGIEWGHYTWNAVTGALSISAVINTDGEWGLASNVPVTIPATASLQGGSLVLGMPDGDGATFTRLSPLPVLTGSGGADTLFGNGSAESFNGFAGNDSIDGGGGVDMVAYTGARAGYTVTRTPSGFTVANPGGTDTDALWNVERLQFTDMKVALDLDGNAGSTAKVLGAVFGASSVAAHPDYMGIGLSLLDGGMSYSALMQLAIDARLGAGASHTAVVDLLYTNVVGSHPGAEDLAFYVGLLDSGTLSVASLGVLAADHSLNAANIGLVGLAETGVAYT